MEYFRDPDNRMQAGFALNAGRLLKQYLDLSLKKNPDERYDATITICVLQALLTNCAELLKAMKGDQKKTWGENVTDIPYRWGIKHHFIVDYTFKPNLTYSKFLTHLRNSLSHPTSTDKDFPYKATGYTTLRDGSGIISKFRFIDSPWVDRGQFISRASSTTESEVIDLIKFFPGRKTLGLEVKRSGNGRYEVYKENQIYYPFFEVEITLSDLVNLAIELANFLAQPVRKDWDGKTIEHIIPVHSI